MTEKDVLSLLAIEDLTAVGASFIGRHIPRGKITGGILLTAVKYGLVLTVLHNYLRAALGASYADIARFLLGKAARREVRASEEAAVASASLNHITTAKLTLEVGNDLLLLFLLLFLFGRDQGFGILTLRVVGASRKLAEATVLNDHLASALIADYICLLNGNVELGILHLLVSLGELTLKVLPKVLKHTLHSNVALLYSVKITLHLCRKLIVYDVGEALYHKLIGKLTRRSGNKHLALSLNVVTGDYG